MLTVIDGNGNSVPNPDHNAKKRGKKEIGIAVPLKH